MILAYRSPPPSPSLGGDSGFDRVPAPLRMLMTTASALTTIAMTATAAEIVARVDNEADWACAAAALASAAAA